MNKIRVLGFVLLVVGIISQQMIDNDLIDFFSGMLIGAGIVLLFTGGKHKPKKRLNTESMNQTN